MIQYGADPLKWDKKGAAPICYAFLNGVAPKRTFKDGIENKERLNIFLKTTPLYSNQSNFLDAFTQAQEMIKKVKYVYFENNFFSFNPSILEIDDNFLLVYRADSYEFDGKKRVDGPLNGAFLGFAELNSNFELLNTPYILSHVPYPSPLSRIHDPRIIKFKDKVYCTFCRQEDLFSVFSPQEPAMYIGEINKVGDHYTLKNMLKLVPPISQSAEKNWSPALFCFVDDFCIAVDC